MAEENCTGRSHAIEQNLLRQAFQESDDEHVVRVYEYTLAHAPATLAQIAIALGIPVDEVGQAIDQLRELRLLRYSDAVDGFRAICPDAAQNELMIPLQQAVNDKRRELAAIHNQLETLSGIFSALRRSQQRDTSVVSLLDPQQAWLRLADAMHDCTSEILAMQTFNRRPSQSFPPYELPVSAIAALVRLICPHAARARTSTRAQLRRMTGLGARVRTTSNIFGDMVLVGSDVAFVAQQASDEDVPIIIAVYDRAIISLLTRMYEFSWQSSQDFETDATSYGVTLTDLNDRILNLMAKGVKDEVIAHRLGIGSRTFRRHLSNIMDDLGADSRFQAGVVAARAGLVEDGQPPGSVRDAHKTPQGREELRLTAHAA